MDVTIFHNPRCSKSRQTLELLRERGLEPTIIEYLKSPPSAVELGALLHKLNLAPRQLMRRSEAAYKESGASDESLSHDELIQRMVDNPVLIERPIVVCGERAALGRPPEAVLAILD